MLPTNWNGVTTESLQLECTTELKYWDLTAENNECQRMINGILKWVQFWIWFFIENPCKMTFNQLIFYAIRYNRFDYSELPKLDVLRMKFCKSRNLFYKVALELSLESFSLNNFNDYHIWYRNSEIQWLT